MKSAPQLSVEVGAGADYSRSYLAMTAPVLVLGGVEEKCRDGVIGPEVDDLLEPGLAEVRIPQPRLDWWLGQGGMCVIADRPPIGTAFCTGILSLGE